MIPYAVYKMIHFLGIFMLFISLGGLAMHGINGGTRQHAWRMPVAITHGIGMFLVLLGGFGLLARLGMTNGLPGWVIGKLVIWLLFGGAIGILLRKPSWSRPLWFILLLLGVGAAFLALYKP